MQWNLNNDGAGKKFEKGKRYELVITHGEEGESTNKGTPFFKLNFETPELEKAYDKTLYNTPKAAYRMIEWAEAMGFASTGEVEITEDSVRGIHITAECDYRKADDGREYLEWINPQEVAIGNAAPRQAQPAAAKKPAPKAAPVDESVPF